MHNVNVNGYDPTPEDVTVRTYTYEGKPRAVVEIGPFVLHASPEAMASVMGEVLRLLASVVASPDDPLIGDHTFLSQQTSHRVTVHTLGGEGYEVEAEQIADHPGGGRMVTGTILRRVQSLSEDPATPPDKGPEVFENGTWRPARPGEVEPTEAETEAGGKLVDLMADLETSVNEAKEARKRHPTRPLSAELDDVDEGGSTDV